MIRLPGLADVRNIRPHSDAIQMIIDPRGHRMSGKWVGYGQVVRHQHQPVDLDLMSSDTYSAHMMRTGQTNRLLGGVAALLTR